jgi:hypothetical protein
MKYSSPPFLNALTSSNTLFSIRPVLERHLHATEGVQSFRQVRGQVRLRHQVPPGDCGVGRGVWIRREDLQLGVFLEAEELPSWTGRQSRAQGALSLAR